MSPRPGRGDVASLQLFANDKPQRMKKDGAATGGGRQRFLRSARLRGAIEFLTSIPLGTGSVPAINGGSLSVGDVSGSLAALKAARGAVRIGERGGGTAAASGPGSPTDADKATGTAAAIVLSGRPFRHVTSRGLRSSRAFRDALLKDGVLDGRIVFARNKEYPSEVFSVIKYDIAAENAYRRDRLVAATAGANLLLEDTAASDASLPLWLRWKGRSYAALLAHSGIPSMADTSAGDAVGGGAADVAAVAAQGSGLLSAASALTGGAGGENDGGALVLTSGDGAGGAAFTRALDPFGLDDPSIGLDKQRFGYRREGYAVSILVFRNERSVKDDINAKFAAAHPWLDHGDGRSLTLSKIRSLKRTAVNLWWSRGRDMSTVALAIVYFDCLVYSRRVNKDNRKLAMAVCLLLAYKMNEAGETEGGDASARAVTADLEAAFGAPRKSILAAEFPVFVHLRFSLANVPAATVCAHLERCLLIRG